MTEQDTRLSCRLLHEGSSPDFRSTFGGLLSQSRSADTAILRIRLGAVDLTGKELAGLRRFRILVAEVSARTVEEETYALSVDPTKRENLHRVLALLRDQRMEIRSAPLGGWSPDFTVFFGDRGPQSLLLGLHWFRQPFPHRGPAWAVLLGAKEARRAHVRFHELWRQSHDIGPAIRRLMERTALPQTKDIIERSLDPNPGKEHFDEEEARKTPAVQGDGPAGGPAPPVDTLSPPG